MFVVFCYHKMPGSQHEPMAYLCGHADRHTTADENVPYAPTLGGATHPQNWGPGGYPSSVATLLSAAILLATRAYLVLSLCVGMRLIVANSMNRV